MTTKLEALSDSAKPSFRFRYVVWAIASLVLLWMTFKQVPTREGDAYEYALILEALYRHFSPDIRLGDIDRLVSLIETLPNQSYAVEPLREMSAAMQAGQSEVLLGVFKTDGGQYFGYHFWFYSLLNLPVKAVLAILNLNELKAFQVTNALMMSATMGYLCRFSKLEVQTRNILLVFYLLGCSIFYLFWPHPEILTAGLVLVASCALCEKRFYLAILAASLSALQNPSSLFFAAIIILAFALYKRPVLLSRKPDRESLKVLILGSLTSLLAFVPYCFYYYYYQIPNLIVEKGFVDKSLIGLPRLSSTLFDLNQGLLVGFPGILLGIASLLAYRLLRVARRQRGHLFNLSDWLLVAFFLVIGPTLGQTNWNHGQSVLSRYVVWSGMLLVTWLAYNLSMLNSRGISKWWQTGLLAVVVLLQLPAHDLFFRNPQASQYLQLKPWTQWLIERLPAAYNPDPEIFAERVTGQEPFGELIAPNSAAAPFVYRDRNGSLTKILVHQSSSAQTESLICGPQGRLLSDSSLSIQQSLSAATFDARNWAYLQGAYRCGVPMQIDFSKQGNLRHFQLGGWAKTQAQGTAMKSARSQLMLPLQNNPKTPLSLKVALQASQPTTLSVSANGTVLSTWTIPAGNVQKTVTIPAAVLANQSALKLSFERANEQGNNQSKPTADTDIELTFQQLIVEPE